MPGKLLIIDSIATNRIILKVRLSSAFYDVVQAENLTDARALVASQPPDLILATATFPQSEYQEFCHTIRSSRETAHIPIVLLQQNGTRAERLRALRAGASDVLVPPLDDLVLLAKLRSLLRGIDPLDKSPLQKAPLGLAEPPAAYQTCPHVLLASDDTAIGMRWRGALKPLLPYELRSTAIPQAMRIMGQSPVPDVFVISVDPETAECAFRLIAEIRARQETRRAGILAILPRPDQRCIVDVLDLGAHDVITDGFDPEEISLRISALVQQKRMSDRLHDNIQSSLQAAVTDPLTGLFNRRYALPQLRKIQKASQKAGAPLAVMMADLDHFKRVNDQFGHAIGDSVLCEATRRMREALPSTALLARLGGEEFLIALPDTTKTEAAQIAEGLCHAMRDSPIRLNSDSRQMAITVSVGATLICANTPARAVEDLLAEADQALYQAKQRGRDQVCFTHAMA